MNALPSESPRRKQNKRKSFSFPNCRLREIERTIPTRDIDQIRAVLPEVAATYRQIIMRRCRLVGEGDLQDRMKDWCTRMRISRTFTDDEIAEAIEQAEQRKGLATQDRLAAILGLEYADRQRLAICTIGAVDLDKRRRTIERKERKRERDRAQIAAKRNKPGRAEWLSRNHLSRTRPWERDGISRRQWERRRARNVASVSPPQESLASDRPATSGTAVPQHTASRDMTSGRDSPLTPRQLDAVIDLAVELGVIEQRGSLGRKNRAA
jgi:hypothetical protein